MRDGQFPAIYATTVAPSADLARDIGIGQALEWRQPTRIRVRCGDQRERTLEATPGSILPGMDVAIFSPPQGRPVLVGAIDQLPVLKGWKNPTAVKLATVIVEGTAPGAVVAAEIPGVGRTALLPPGNIRAQVGEVFAAVPRENNGTTVTKTIAVSTALPQSTGLLT